MGREETIFSGTENETEFEVLLEIELFVERYVGRTVEFVIPVSVQTMAQKVYDLFVPVESPGFQPLLLVLQKKRQHLVDAGLRNRRKL